MSADKQSIPLTKEWFEKNGNDIGAILIEHGALMYEIEFAAGKPGIGIDLTVYKGPCFVNMANLPTINTVDKLNKLIELLKEV